MHFLSIKKDSQKFLKLLLAQLLRYIKLIRIIIFSFIIMLFNSCSDTSSDVFTPNYTQNRPPLAPKPYLELPIGSIKPDGWLLEQLITMKNGLTGHLDELYEPVLGPRNGWLGGDGDGWERGPYWLDGLVPLAYILDDQELKDKAMKWIEWSIRNQSEDGYFGPQEFLIEPEPESGLQKTRRQDWWPKMVMLKVLQQYYSSTGDKRVIRLMTEYFKYQLKHLPETPLDNWSFWANRRGGDNLMVVYWLYNITGDEFLLDLAKLIHKQTFPWTEIFLNENCYKGPELTHLYPYNVFDTYPFDTKLISRLCVKQLQSFHCVNLAQGIKEPVIYYQQDPDPLYIKAVKKAFRDIKEFHGQPQGMYGGDEPLHGKIPTQGVELCSVVELMFSLENILKITGDIQFAEYLERIAYNALPAQIKQDFSSRQYFQSANQVILTRHRHNFYEEDNHGGTDLCFGLLTGYPCCTCNMHQGWPKLIQNLFYSTKNNGVAAFIYAPCHVEMLVSDSVPIRIAEKTDYPFDENVTFTISCPDGTEFPFQLRIPSWCSSAEIRLNNEKFLSPAAGTMCIINREWDDGDQVKLILPMKISFSRWVENSVAVERGPLLYALRIFEEWTTKNDGDRFGEYEEVRPLDPWNFGLVESVLEDPEHGFKVVKTGADILHPWSAKNTPLEIVTQGKIIPEWTLYNEMPGPLPQSLPQTYLKDVAPIEITLIPYGCTRLRITEFPIIK